MLLEIQKLESKETKREQTYTIQEIMSNLIRSLTIGYDDCQLGLKFVRFANNNSRQQTTDVSWPNSSVLRSSKSYD